MATSSRSLGEGDPSLSLKEREVLLLMKIDEKRVLAIELRRTLVSVLAVGAAKTVDERVGRNPELVDEKGRRPTNLRSERERERRREDTEDS